METAIVFISLWVVSALGIHQVNKPVDNICIEQEQTVEK